jgi:two-component system copper resistance phosphate regulon response regulator CusR
MRVLIAEDEEKAARFLRKGLSESGFQVDVVQTGDAALDATNHARYDLIILDVTLPGLDGIEVVRQLRQQNIATPVIHLTARDGLQDKINGIEAGANVYLVKPFSFSEVLAYARSLTKRSESVRHRVIRVLDLEIDLDRQKARRGGRTLELTAKEFSLLSLLARRSGQVFSRSIIADEIWGMNYDSGTNVVDVHIRRLRSKVDDPFPKKLIWTVRGSGYVLEVRDEDGHDSSPGSTS